MPREYASDEAYFFSHKHWLVDTVNGQRINALRNIEYYLTHATQACTGIGYFYIDVLTRMQLHLDQLEYWRIIMGDETDEQTAVTIQEGITRRQQILDQVTQQVITALDSFDYNQFGSTLDLFTELIAIGKIDVKIYTRRKYHKKIYWFQCYNAEYPISANGSANFTKSGLIENDESLEFARDPDTTQHYYDEFYEDWTAAEPFNEDLLHIIDTHPRVRAYRQHLYTTTESPRGVEIEGFTYLLPEQFFLTLAKKRGDLQYLASPVKLAPFQITDYLSCYQCIQNTGGVILADEAGIGKTIIACRLIQNYSNQNKRFLIIAPPNVLPNWEKHLHLFGIQLRTSKLISLGMLQQESFLGYNWEGFDAVILDEAHNLRNDGTARFSNFMDGFKATNPAADVILLTATPINNSIKDLASEIRLIENGGRFRLSLGNTFDLFKTLVRRLAALSELEHDRLMELADTLQERLVVRTTSRQLRNVNEEFYIDGHLANYQEVIPQQIHYTFSGDIYTDLFEHLIPDFLDQLHLPHAGFLSSAEQQTEFTRGILQLYKRFESSIYAFIQSIQHIESRERRLASLLCDPDIPALVEQIRTDAKNGHAQESAAAKARKKNVLDRYAAAPELTDAAWRDALETVRNRIIQGKSVTIYLQEIAADLHLIGHYLMILQQLRQDAWHFHDDKLAMLIDRLRHLPPTAKVLIFTQFSDTAAYLTANLQHADLGTVDMITGGLPYTTRSLLLARFSPSKINPTEMTRLRQRFPNFPPPLRILIATDTLAEGVNLPDARYVINYDLSWNPMMMYQRNSRARRIDNPNPVDIWNFIPDANIDQIINLIEILQSKISVIAHVIGLSSKILSEADEYRMTDQEVVEEFTRRQDAIRRGDFSNDILDGASISPDPFQQFLSRLFNYYHWTAEKINAVTIPSTPIITLLRDTTLSDTFFYTITQNATDHTLQHDYACFDGQTLVPFTYHDLLLAAESLPLRSDEQNYLQHTLVQRSCTAIIDTYRVPTAAVRSGQQSGLCVLLRLPSASSGCAVGSSPSTALGIVKE